MTLTMKCVYDLVDREHALAQVRSGISISAVSRATGISRAAIRDWLVNGTASKSGNQRSCFRCDGEVPLTLDMYAYLLGLYLGDGCISRTHKPGVHVLRIFCADAWPGLADACERAMGILGTKVRRVPRDGCHEIVSYSKHWTHLFPQHGPGPKHRRPIVLQAWQRRIVHEQARDFIRGLIHSDGCRFTNPVVRHFKSGTKKYSYPRYMFTNESVDIRNLFTDALDRLGIPWRYSRRNTISVARREAVAALDVFVGPKY